MALPANSKILAPELIQDICRRIGYSFQDTQLLITALTHRSLAANWRSYERLEFLGDRILGFIVGEMLYQQLPNADEGELSRRLASLVNRKFLSEWMQRLEIGDFIQMSAECRARNLQSNPAILSDIAESLLAAIYLDSDLQSAICFVQRDIGIDIENFPIEKDAKSRLQDWCQAEGLPLPIYREISRQGSDHLPWFEFEVKVVDKSGKENDFLLGFGYGGSKREAMQEAACHYWQNHHVIKDSDGNGENNG